MFAAAAGSVTRVDNSHPAGFRRRGGFGNHVRIRHSNGYLTIYAHLAPDSIRVEEDSDVTPGQQIALSDTSGFSRGPHLHFEVRDPDGVRVNPYGDPPDYAGGCGANPLWATCPPQPWSPAFADNDSDGYTVAEGDCLDSGETPEGVPASVINPDADEVCNYTDDDCDGQTDEGFPGLLTPCTVGVGACQNTGVYVCTADFMSTACSSVPFPSSPETCDGVDNDCDGATDEGLLNACGVCGSAPVEVCDELDNDCDGGVDEGFTITCGSAAIACVAGVLIECGCCDGVDNDVDGFIDQDDSDCHEFWCTIATFGAPAARDYHTAVWTGSAMVVWGGAGQDSRLNTGSRYDSETDSWSRTSTVGAPAARYLHTAVWTGSAMVVWGGRDGWGEDGLLNTGSRYDPETDSWSPVSTVGAPAARYLHTAVWTGSAMVVWGGSDEDGPLNTGGRYTPP
ncbi:peptidoglycan DD-metalloendopeptidase family protein [Candidatus Uhrbacteria bacterium]|nr:peptidoglycan DD-metalloendopeptidase family protein [Candidatus Uhrbacteria bacterium]